jgi:hypothetical protein
MLGVKLVIGHDQEFDKKPTYGSKARKISYHIFWCGFARPQGVMSILPAFRQNTLTVEPCAACAWLRV